MCRAALQDLANCREPPGKPIGSCALQHQITFANKYVIDNIIRIVKIMA
jgi:hypothetical protein